MDLLERHFRQDEMIHALFQLCELVGELLPQKRQQSQGRTATRAQAKDVVKMVEKLDKGNRLPRFMIHCDELGRVLPLIGAISISEERTVSARMEALEIGLRKLTDVVTRTNTIAVVSSPPTSQNNVPSFVGVVPTVRVHPVVEHSSTRNYATAVSRTEQMVTPTTPANSAGNNGGANAPPALIPTPMEIEEVFSIHPIGLVLSHHLRREKLTTMVPGKLYHENRRERKQLW